MNSNWNKLAISAFIGCMLASVWTAGPKTPVKGVIELPRLQFDHQKTQARELLNQVPSILSDDAEIQRRLGLYIYHTIQASLPQDYRTQAQPIAETLINEANRYQLDPLFLLAVIKTESRFNPKAVGRHGDSGLMQILPKTAHWVAEGNGMKGPVNLLDPVVNIKIGAAYFARLRSHFAGVGSRYLAAYNMGTRNVHRLLKEAKEPMLYANRVVINYQGFYKSWSAILNEKSGSGVQIVSMN